MSDNIPFDIQVDIIKRLPVKSLIQFRSVSKAWKFLIDSSDFIARYNVQMQHLLVRYGDFSRKYVSIADDDTFPQQRSSLTPPGLVKMLRDCSVIGSSHGLLCFSGSYHKGRRFSYSFFGTHMAVLWNISIRKAVGVVLTHGEDRTYSTTLGFGVCRKTIEPKIVKIGYISEEKDLGSITHIPWQVEVFTLSTGAWRSPYSSNLPSKSIELFGFQVVVDGFLYWLATDRIAMDGEFSSHNLIISFDMTSEEFREINLPDSLTHIRSQRNLSIFNLRKSLAVLEAKENEIAFMVWMMNDGASKSFTKLFSICTPDASILSVLGFRKSGEPIIEILSSGRDSLEDPASLAVYEPCSKRIDDIDGIYSFSFSMSFYMETLLLLDQPNFIIYDKVNATES